MSLKMFVQKGTSTLSNSDLKLIQKKILFSERSSCFHSVLSKKSEQN